MTLPVHQKFEINTIFFKRKLYTRITIRIVLKLPTFTLYQLNRDIIFVIVLSSPLEPFIIAPLVLWKQLMDGTLVLKYSFVKFTNKVKVS